jgi:hypothetical protein
MSDQDDSEPRIDSKISDCEFLLQHVLRNVGKSETTLNWVVLTTIVAALLSTLTNMGALSSQEISLGFATLRVHNLVPIKLFLCFASIAGFLVVVYCIIDFIKIAHTIEFLATEKNFDKATIIMDFGLWRLTQKTTQVKLFSYTSLALCVLFFAITVVVPLTTLVLGLWYWKQ